MKEKTHKIEDDIVAYLEGMQEGKVLAEKNGMTLAQWNACLTDYVKHQFVNSNPLLLEDYVRSIADKDRARSSAHMTNDELMDEIDRQRNIERMKKKVGQSFDFFKLKMTRCS